VHQHERYLATDLARISQHIPRSTKQKTTRAESARRFCIQSSINR
jgi:hypothetical protein